MRTKQNRRAIVACFSFLSLFFGLSYAQVKTSAPLVVMYKNPT